MDENIIKLKNRNKEIIEIIDAYNMTKLALQIQELVSEVISRTKVKDVFSRIKEDFKSNAVNIELDNFVNTLFKKDSLESSVNYKEEKGVSFIKRDGHYNSSSNKNE